MPDISDLDDPELKEILSRKAMEIIKESSKKDNNKNIDINEGPIELNDNNFDEFISKNKGVVVDFWAPWCAPCHMLSPMLEDLSTKYTDIKFVKVNADESPMTASKFYVMSLPTTMLFLNGEPVDRIVGVVPYEVLEERIRWLQAKLY
ncbi:thioredoxin [Caldisphaera lagunensis DSM 15908]|uniref:Thioredoxin n=1 Tax=Caldisphaera lagunensis (strain DSM 15908 / JCM 11604 / ANMR 0165 / IC-154) TaxID=1056495 RepID=L0AB55_CALLD|nr:thioredoxin [Caldisphaera lagunensis]AFZ70377.1 thioredoxin [Caldisphaera lagunensis DSM 15908]